MSKAKKIAIVSDASGNISGANISYTGALTGSTGILNIGSGQVYKDASGNVGIGTSSPAAKLDVAATIRSTSQGTPSSGSGLEIIGGSTQNYIVAYNRTTPAFLPLELQSSLFTVGVGGSERMRIDSSGNVGIGTTTPIAVSPAYGSLTLNGTTGGIISFRTNNTTETFRLQTQSTVTTINNIASIPMVFNTNNTERMRIDPVGNVGIGTSSPAAKLDVQGGRSYFASNSDAFASYLRYNNSTAGVFLGSPSANAFQISSSGGGAYLNINSSGNLGIGTTNPTQRLHVMGSTIFDFTHGQNIKLGVSAGNNGNTTYSGDAYLYLWASEPGATWTGAGIGRNIVNTSNFPRVNTNLSGQMIRFDEGDSPSISLITETKAGTRYTPLYVTNGDVFMNSGNLMIGATSSVNTNTKIYAVTAGQDDNNGIIQAYNTNSAAGNSASLVTKSYWGTGQFMSWASSGMRIGMRIVTNGGSAAVYYTYANDNIGFGNNSALGTGVLYTNGGLLTNTNPSDARLKTDIQDITLGLDFISQLKPVSYKWLNNRANQDTQYGFIAQDVQEIEPSLVREFEAAVDIDSENSDDHKTVTRLGLEEKGIYTAMVKAIQELKIIIDTQNARIEALEGVK
jgi:hypothetical protein